MRICARCVGHFTVCTDEKCQSQGPEAYPSRVCQRLNTCLFLACLNGGCPSLLSALQHHTSADVQHFRFLLGAIASAEAEYQGEWQDSHAKALLDRCLDMVDDLEASAEAMPPALAEVHGQLALMHKELHAMASTGQPPAGGDLQRLQSALDRIDNQRAHSGGVFGGGEAGEEGGIKAPPGQAVCAHLLEECYRWVKDCTPAGVGCTDVAI